jgi:hypothetical protein
MAEFPSRSLTYVEIDIPDFTAFSAMATLRYAIDSRHLPTDILAIPSLLEVKIDPAIISLGEDMGTRATVTCTFRDHRHIFNTEDFYSGTYWGKFRARYGLTLRGYPLRVITGYVGDTLANMETRNFIIESTDGPSAKGEFKIVAKDVLKFADGDRAQAPRASNGFLVADITNVATTATLSPSGIGNAEYPSSGLVAIGGSEICSFTRSADVLTLTRGQKNTTAVAHTAQDRVQLCLQYTAINPSFIIWQLLTVYAGVPTAYIDLTSWGNETGPYLGTVYTATIAEPTSVNQLVSELIEQVGLALWWDSITQQIKLQVLRPIPSTADIYDADRYLADTINVTEQPEKRLSQVITYFGKINPLINDDQINNYRSTSYIVDTAAEAAYGSSVVKKIYSRWIADGGRSVADTLGNVLLARFRDPPRRIGLSILRGSIPAPVLGTGYQIKGWQFQDTSGNPVAVPAQVTSLNPRADYFEIEAEEISSHMFGVASPGDHVVILDANIYNVNLRTMHDSLYGTPVSGNTVTCIINSGVIVGSTSTSAPAFDVGSWPAGVTVFLTINGRIEGCGGRGGDAGVPGYPGGSALFTRQAITVTANQIYGGGGGGGGGGHADGTGDTINASSSGGGGGAGRDGGFGGTKGVTAPSRGFNGNQGTADAGGTGGQFGVVALWGGDGGGPGLNGNASIADGSVGISAQAGGVAGNAIDGVSFITFTTSPHGDIRGGQIN